jgi:hypothetical protein
MALAPSHDALVTLTAFPFAKGLPLHRPVMLEAKLRPRVDDEDSGIASVDDHEVRPVASTPLSGDLHENANRPVAAGGGDLLPENSTTDNLESS